jgi:hypothetical protein
MAKCRTNREQKTQCYRGIAGDLVDWDLVEDQMKNGG